ncbi:OmpH family outer membrane protein [Fulvivirga ulvae]|uniref:OmpH family outer membrane protein n=1 Tax=Fulvivirga ulvae TaxID=2904245 RepID=UPI001F465C80|nr:OmpH family outer membrane protein [Fulvivirga ulvae]UII31547.1 OmpH family outer membrane protein [Fulvivirga ulvae]
MKNLSLVLNIILLVAVGVLFYLHFSGKKSEPEQEPGMIESAEYSVAYINADSVLSNYDFFKEMQEKLQEKGQKLEDEYKSRAQGLQKEVNDYQRNVNNLTIGQAKAVEENLMKKQQNLRMYQESLSQDLIKEESKINQELYEKITSFLNDYSQNHGLQMVVKYNQGSDVLYASDSMNITNAVISGLNDAYKKEKEVVTDKTNTDTTAVN